MRARYGVCSVSANFHLCSVSVSVVLYTYTYTYIYRSGGCLVTWFCYQLMAKPGNKTAAVLWPDPYIYIYIWHWTVSDRWFDFSQKYCEDIVFAIYIHIFHNRTFLAMLHPEIETISQGWHILTYTKGITNHIMVHYSTLNGVLRVIGPRRLTSGSHIAIFFCLWHWAEYYIDGMLPFIFILGLWRNQLSIIGFGNSTGCCYRGSPVRPIQGRRMALIARLMGPKWGPSGADRTQVGLMLAPWTLLSGGAFRLWHKKNNRSWLYGHWEEKLLQKSLAFKWKYYFFMRNYRWCNFTGIGNIDDVAKLPQSYPLMQS